MKQQGNKAVFDQGTDKATPLHYAACKIVECLNCAMLWSACDAVGTGHIETAEWLLKSDVSGRLISAKDKNGDTPAHDAAENGYNYKLFINQPVNDLAIAYSWPVYHKLLSLLSWNYNMCVWILFCSQTEMLKFLLEAGADLYIINDVSVTYFQQHS